MSDGYLLDTNVVSELRKRRPDAAVRDWLRARTDAEIWTSVLVIGELRRGVERLRRRDPASASAIDAWLTELVDRFDGRILNVTRPIAERWGRLGIPDPVPDVDGLLAATALEHDLTVVTRNVDDLARAGATTVNPFRA